MEVSVIIPVYNAEKTIQKSIDSVVTALEKKTDSYEIICIDDGSKDNSLEVLESLKQRNPKIIVVHQDNRGAATARNTGLEIAKGEYIAFNDSDDEWLENHYEILKNVFDTNKDLICVSGNHDVDKQKIPHLKKISENLYKISLKDELLKNYYSPQATMLKAKVVNSGIRFKTGMRYAEEGYFFYTIVSKYPCVYMNEKITQSILGKEKFGDGGLSGNLLEMEKGELQNLKYAYNKLSIGFSFYCFAIFFSLIKYVRRLIIVKFRTLKK